MFFNKRQFSVYSKFLYNTYWFRYWHFTYTTYKAHVGIHVLSFSLYTFYYVKTKFSLWYSPLQKLCGCGTRNSLCSISYNYVIFYTLNSVENYFWYIKQVNKKLKFSVVLGTLFVSVNIFGRLWDDYKTTSDTPEHFLKVFNFLYPVCSVGTDLPFNNNSIYLERTTAQRHMLQDYW